MNEKNVQLESEIRKHSLVTPRLHLQRHVQLPPHSLLGRRPKPRPVPPARPPLQALPEHRHRHRDLAHQREHHGPDHRLRGPGKFRSWSGGISFVFQICKVLAAVDPSLGSACTDLEAQLPDIIQYILTENLSPQEVCVCLRSCEGDCIINPSNSTVNTAWSN